MFSFPRIEFNVPRRCCAFFGCGEAVKRLDFFLCYLVYEFLKEYFCTTATAVNPWKSAFESLEGVKKIIIMCNTNVNNGTCEEQMNRKIHWPQKLGWKQWNFFLRPVISVHFRYFNIYFTFRMHEVGKRKSVRFFEYFSSVHRKTMHRYFFSYIRFVQSCWQLQWTQWILNT